jgi:hypothetical protein
MENYHDYTSPWGELNITGVLAGTAGSDKLDEVVESLLLPLTKYGLFLYLCHTSNNNACWTTFSWGNSFAK